MWRYKYIFYTCIDLIFIILKGYFPDPTVVALFFSYEEIRVNALKYSSVAIMHSNQAV